MDRSKALREENVGTLLRKFSLPAIIGMIVNALYNVIDSIFVGRGVGETALAAVTISFPIMLIMMGFGMLVGIGAASLVSLRLGEQKKAEAEKILGNSLTLILIIAISLSILLLLFLNPILVKLGADANVLPYAYDFIRIILFGSIFMYIGFGLNNIIRAEGNPKIAMATMIISAVLNTILNPLFIFVFKLGIAGSALATVCAQSVSALWVISYFLSKRSVLKLSYCNMKLDINIVKGIFKIGLSPFLMQIAASIVTVIFNNSLMQYGGQLAVASIGIINRVAMLMLMPIFGISQGAQPIIGFNYGAKSYGRVIEALKKATIAATAISILAFVLTQAFDEQIISLFNNNPQLVHIGTNGLRIFFFMFPVIGFQVICANYFQAVGKAGHAIFLSMSRQVILLIPLIFVLPKFFGLNGVWLAGPISDLLSAIITGIYIFVEVKKLKHNKDNIKNVA